MPLDQQGGMLEVQPAGRPDADGGRWVIIRGPQVGSKMTGERCGAENHGVRRELDNHGLFGRAAVNLARGGFGRYAALFPAAIVAGGLGSHQQFAAWTDAGGERQRQTQQIMCPAAHVLLISA